MHHVLKTWPAYFDAIVDGRKKFELRRDDRGFQVGDWLELREWDPVLALYTGRVARVEVTYLMGHGPVGGLAPGFVILGIALLGVVPSPA